MLHLHHVNLQPIVGAGTPFARQPGLTLGLVSLIVPIKQFPSLFSILAPALARRSAIARAG